MLGEQWPTDPALRRRPDGDCDFGDPLAEAAAALDGHVRIPLCALGTLRVGGEDAQEFLHNQLSSDLRRLTAERAQLSSYNTPKGRTLAVLTLWRDADAILLEMPRAILAPTLQHLRRYVLRAKVNFQDVSEKRPALGIAGPQAPAMLAQANLPVPGELLHCARDADLIILRRPGAIPRFSLHGPAQRLAALWAQWATRARAAGDEAWRLLDIEAGIPAVYAATAEHFVPQMLALDRLGAISFDKGCYPGQEIVARLHYLGQLKRGLYKAYCEAAAAPGDAVYRLGEAQPCGEIVSAARHPRRGHALLAVLPLELPADAALRLNKPDVASLSGLAALAPHPPN
jgi:folate-binding protein YgfZ